MKKAIALLLALILTLSVFAGCAKEEKKQDEGQNDEKSYNVLLLVPKVGDKSYFDGAAAGMTLLSETYDNVTTEVITMGSSDEDMANYPTFFRDACESGKYDLIVTGAAECTNALVEVAAEYPDQLFFDFDYQDTFGNELTNVYGVYYKTYDMGYLAGYLAAQITTSDMELANEEKMIGAVVGIDFPDLNDFVGSFCQAAIDCGVTAKISYCNTFTETQPAYDCAKALHDEGCDVVWQIAGSAGLGVFEASVAEGFYAFGVDMDQVASVGDAALTANVVTSFQKDYGNMIVSAFQKMIDGTYPGGTYEAVGLKEHGVGLVDNDQYKALVPQEIRDSVNVVYEKVTSGEVTPFSAMENQDEWAVIRDTAAKLIADKDYNVLLLVPKVGDKSYFDGAAAGMTLLENTYANVTTEVITMGSSDEDMANYPTFFREACESGKYDLIVTGAAECTKALVEVAAEYPDQLFFDFDYQDTFGNDLPNVYGVYYKTYDMGYLAGYLAAQITTSDMEFANADKKIGAVVGIDFPDLNDFVGSFCQAAIDCGVQATISYCNTFTETQPAYDCAKALHDDGCDVVWQVAGSAGLGVFEASVAEGFYAFGVDMDQVASVGDAALTANVVTSFQKDYAAMILNAFQMMLKGTYPGGTYEAVGLKEHGVGLVDNDQYKALVSQEIRDSVSVVYEKVTSGEVTPLSAMVDQETWAKVRDQAALPVD